VPGDADDKNMDGVLLLDKPSGPTSHDVVARIRAVTHERSVGHTGTLDPRATGLLPLVLGRATRLASVLSASDKTYEASIRLGVSTSTDDADGQVTATFHGDLPGLERVDEALSAFRGSFEQTPPIHSAKRVGGKKAYDLARRDAPVELKPVTVTVLNLLRQSYDDGLVRLEVTATSGFYVRALARDLGQALGCGGHLDALRRTRVGVFDVTQAMPLAEAERLGEAVESRVLTPADALGHLAALTLTEAGLRRALHGNPVGPEHLEKRFVPPSGSSAAGRVRLLGQDGRLVALAHSRGGLLHPAVVLG
jgi:tRNA pseudouridine55 synthase